MIGSQATIPQEDTGAELSEVLIDMIIDKIVAGTNAMIARIDPSWDRTADYYGYSTRGKYDYDDFAELDEPYTEYEVTYRCELTWDYCEWTECWSDPPCCPSFSELRNETGQIYNIEIRTPDGEAVKQNICKRIEAMVNESVGDI